MPRCHRVWICNRCRKRFPTYREAEGCEIHHITEDAISGFRDDLDLILGKKDAPQ